ncbi:MAG: AAA family ATPase [Candidatus Sumerlaeaceae bacterium]|jgi:cytidylate kinase
MKTLSDFLAAYSQVIARRDEEAGRREVCHPPIVLSREIGSGGRRIAEALAGRLGFVLCDKQILDELAERAKVPKDFLAMLDERPAKALELLGASLLRGVSLTPEDYERVLKSGLRALLRLGSVVIVGRGAIFLAEPGKALRVRVVAPRHLRIKNLMNYENISDQEAAKRIEKIEKERAEFLRRYFGAEEARADCFDIAVNTECLSIENCVDLIMEAYKKLFKCGEQIVGPAAQNLNTSKHP